MSGDGSTLDALLRLLADESRAVVEAVTERLVGLGEAGERAVREAARGADPRLRARARAVLERIGEDRAEAEIRRLLRRVPHDLEAGAYALGRFVDPACDAAACAASLGRFAARLAPLARGATEPLGLARAVGAFFGEELGFRGAEPSDYVPENSCLPRVVETRRGLPITLSLVYVLVGARAGIPIRPVGMPSHFLVRLGPEALDLLLDPFHGGRVLRSADAAALLASRGLSFGPGVLAEPTPRAILVRMAGNLVVAFEKTGNARRARRASRLREVLAGAPGSAS